MTLSSGIYTAFQSSRAACWLDYNRDGYIDLYRKEFVLKNNKLFGNKVMAYITPLTMEIESKDELNYMNSYDNNKNTK